VAVPVVAVIITQVIRPQELAVKEIGEPEVILITALTLVAVAEEKVPPQFRAVVAGVVMVVLVVTLAHLDIAQM
jgi:hypothetical protein